MLPRAARPRRGHRRAVPRAAAAQNGAAGGGFDYDLVIVGAGVGGHGAALHAFEEDAAFDIKLPRRSLLVEFTCTKCDARTKRLINRAAYDRGTVFLQCARCQVYHKFVDNLGLIVEYDLREENELDSTVDVLNDKN